MKLYEFVGGTYNGKILNEDQAICLYQNSGTGFTKDWSKERTAGHIVPCKELDHEMTFHEYLNPMYDGERYLVNGEWKYEFQCSEEEKKTSPEAYVLRYETEEVYDQLSR